jgi:NAD-dependent dihydropyrimidine dehydrogenase PreA subunit
MSLLRYTILNILETLLRVIPFPCKTGLTKIGSPDRNSPVFLTCNYHLTVERVKRVLKGTDCFLLVANSRGYNVWCGAAGGHFTNHDVVSVLKTTALEDLVDHRNVILPQLAAAGIESTFIEKKTGWKIIWGPVYAKDIPFFIEHKFQKTPDMRKVGFPLAQRIEMAVMWAFPFSIIASIIIISFLRGMLLPLNALIWGLPLLVFVSFPLYSRWLNPKKKGTRFSKYTVIFDFGRIPLLFFVIFLSCLVVWSISLNTFTYGFILRWGFVSFVVLLLISSDLMGSTPVYKSGLHEDRFLKVKLDEEKCKGAGLCEQVCPRNCYEVDRDRNIAAIPRSDQCVQCGACIVQCPCDALYFESPHSKVINTETVRKFKLNLMGKRLKETKEIE